MSSVDDEEAEMETARRDSWKTRAMPPETAVLDYSAEYSPDEFERLSRGLIPQAMEDKWFVYLEGDVLHFHRSWTGICIYQVSFGEENGKHTRRDRRGEPGSGAVQGNRQRLRRQAAPFPHQQPPAREVRRVPGAFRHQRAAGHLPAPHRRNGVSGEVSEEVLERGCPSGSK